MCNIFLYVSMGVVVYVVYVSVRVWYVYVYLCECGFCVFVCVVCAFMLCV